MCFQDLQLSAINLRRKAFSRIPKLIYFPTPHVTPSKNQIFHIARNGKSYGPYDKETLIHYLEESIVSQDDHLWDSSLKKWVRISETEYCILPTDECELDPGEALAIELSREWEALPKEKESVSFPNPKDPKPLAEWLGIEEEELNQISQNSVSMYKPFPIHRPGKKDRWIEAPDERLKTIQRLILDKLLTRIPLNGAAHGFVPNRSIMTHASEHRRKRWVVTLDIRSFFPSVDAERVRSVAFELPILKEDVETFVNLTTRNNHLPQGAPTSPTLGNLVLRELDRKLCDLVRGTGWFYTRYADDLTFSGFKKPKKILLQASQLIKEEGFRVSHEKSRIRGKDDRQMVTGIVVNDKLALSREKRNMVRGMRHRLNRGEVPEHELNHVLGWLNFADYVEHCNHKIPRRGPSVRPRRISLKKICLALDLASNGKPSGQIMSTLGISRSSYYRTHDSRYIKTKLKAHGIGEPKVEKICNLLEAGEIQYALDLIISLSSQ